MVSKVMGSKSVLTIAFACLATVTWIAGCDRSGSTVAGPAGSGPLSSEYSDIRAIFWSPEPIAGQAKSPTEIKEATTEVQPTAPVVIAGRIDAGEFDAFGEGEATFVLSQLPDDSHGASDPDHADNCPFCKRKLKNAPKAIVRFETDGNEVIQVGADEIFGLKKDDIVLVQGEARYDEALNTVMVNAKKLSRK